MPYKNNKRHSKYFWNNRLGLIWFGSVWMCDCDHISSFNSLLFSITIGITAVISIKLPNWMGLGIAISNNRYELLGKEEKIGFFLSFTWNHLPIYCLLSFGKHFDLNSSASSVHRFAFISSIYMIYSVNLSMWNCNFGYFHSDELLLSTH